MKTTTLILLMSCALSAQTVVKPENIGVSSAVPNTLLAIVDGKFVVVQLGASLIIDSTTTPATIRVGTVAAPVQFAVEVLRPTAPMSILTLSAAPLAGSLTIARNGVVQSEGVDYSITGRDVAFLAASRPLGGDVVRAAYVR